MDKRLLFVVLVIGTVLLSACSQIGFNQDLSEEICVPKYDVNGQDLNDCGVVDTANNDLDTLLEEIENELNTNKTEDLSESPVEEIPVVGNSEPVKRVVEGDTVELNPKVTDPDGNLVKVSFSLPLDKNGVWVTKEGDAGTYMVTITATDGKSVSEQKVKIIVEPMNKAPVITINDTLRFNEGDLIVLKPEIVDPEGEELTVTYSGWLESDTYQTTYEDSGIYVVTITATDGERESIKAVKINILNKNRAPEIELLSKLSVVEEDLVTLDVNVADPDGDDVTVEYSVPFDEEGEWQTKIGDAGVYKVVVSASDGDLTSDSSIELLVEAKNRPPVLQKIADIYVNEGEIVEIKTIAIDPEGEKLTITYSGWMTSNTYTTDYDDQGTHIVTVTVSDGIHSDSQDVKVIVSDVNRAPVFSCIVDCE